MQRLTWLLIAVALGGCRSGAEPPAYREPPPPEVKPSASICMGSPHFNDATNVRALPAKTGTFCLDPAGSDHGYGEGAKAPLEPGICELFDGECAIYLALGVKRVDEARYVDAGGTSATIDIKLSTFGTPEQALAMFTKRALSAGDPVHPDTPKPMAAGALATLGIGNAYVWRSTSLVELTVNDASLTAEQLQKKADALLPPLAKEIGEKLAGELGLPRAAALLPTEGRLPIGIQYELPNVLVAGAGPGASGFYQEGAKRWRVVAVVAATDERAHEVLHALARGGAPEKKLGDTGFRTVIGETKAEWFFSRKGPVVLGVGDESYVLRNGMSKEERAQSCLTREEKMTKLKGAFPRSAGAEKKAPAKLVKTSKSLVKTPKATP